MREKGPVKMEAGMAIMQPQAKACLEPEAVSGKDGFSSRPFQGSVALLHLDQTSGIPNCTRINFCCFKPQNLW